MSRHWHSAWRSIKKILAIWEIAVFKAYALAQFAVTFLHIEEEEHALVIGIIELVAAAMALLIAGFFCLEDRIEMAFEKFFEIFEIVRDLDPEDTVTEPADIPDPGTERHQNAVRKRHREARTLPTISEHTEEE